jgi:hypothetical protein
LGHIHLPDLFCVWLIVSLARSAGPMSRSSTGVLRQ